MSTSQRGLASIGGPYIPLDLLGQFITPGGRIESVSSAAADQGELKSHLVVHGIFFDRESYRLFRAHADLPHCQSLKGLSWQTLTIERPISMRIEQAIEACREFVDEGLSSGMEVLSGQWHVQPSTGKLVDADCLPPNIRANLCVSESGTKSASRAQSESPTVGPGADRLQPINDRLAEVNPHLEHWFV